MVPANARCASASARRCPPARRRPKRRATPTRPLACFHGRARPIRSRTRRNAASHAADAVKVCRIEVDAAMRSSRKFCRRALRARRTAWQTDARSKPQRGSRAAAYGGWHQQRFYKGTLQKRPSVRRRGVLQHALVRARARQPGSGAAVLPRAYGA